MRRRPNIPTPYQIRGGIAPPAAVSRLPIDLLRTGLYPKDQARVSAAMATYYRHMGGAPMPTRLPQSMAFQQWKTDPDGKRRAWDHSLQSWHALMQQYDHGVPTRVARVLPPPPMYSKYMAARARGAEILPQPATTTVPVVARGVRQNTTTSRFLGRAMPPPSAFVRGQEIAALRRRADVRAGFATAINNATAAISRTRQLVRG